MRRRKAFDLEQKYLDNFGVTNVRIGDSPVKVWEFIWTGDETIRFTGCHVCRYHQNSNSGNRQQFSAIFRMYCNRIRCFR